MTFDIIVRLAHRDEAPLLSDLALRSKAHWGYSPEFIKGCRKELTYTSAQIAAAEFAFVVAERSQDILGFYALRGKSPKAGSIEALFVEPRQIGQGVGRILLDHARHTAAGWGLTSLEVASDPHATEFYESAGATAIGTEESTVTPGRFLPLLLISIDPASE